MSNGDGADDGRSEYQRTLSDRTSDGSGCAETWEATQAIRADNSNRRQFMAGLVGSIFFGATATSTVSAKEVDVETDPDKTIRDLSKSELRSILRTAVANRDVGRIQEQLDSEGLDPDYSSVKAKRVTYKEEEWRWIRIPYTDSTDSSRNGTFERKGAVVWNSYEKVEPYGYVTEQSVDRGAELSNDIVDALAETDIDVADFDTVPVTVEHRTFAVENGDVSIDANSRTVPIATDREKIAAESDEVSTEDGCGCTAFAGNPLMACAPCSTIDTDCVSDIAQNYSVEIVACGACVGTGGWATWKCAACIAAVLESDGGDNLCCWYNSCSVPIVC